MSEILQNQHQTASKPRKLQIQTSFNESDGLSPPSQLWLQYSHTNLKTPVSVKNQNRPASEYYQFSNILYKQAGSSQFEAASDNQKINVNAEQQNEHKKLFFQNTKQNKTRNNKQEFISELQISQNQKNQILGKSQQQINKIQTKPVLDFGYGQNNSSVSSRSFEQGKDIKGSKRKYVLDQPKKQQKQSKQPQVCSACYIM